MTGRRRATAREIPVYLEVGTKRVFAGVIDWPGWCRSGRDETSAVQALLDVAPRYARAIASARLGFHGPAGLQGLRIRHRFPGDATTDFGAPGVILPSDNLAPDPGELRRLVSIMKACWRTFDRAVADASGASLRKGPRGGGRDLQAIVRHTEEAEAAYLTRLGAQAETAQSPSSKGISRGRERVIEALAASARGEFPARGPRGGIRWSTRSFVRRAAWHLLDHAWEIEDRAEGRRAC